MKSMVVSDPVPGCQIESVELHYESINPTICAPDGSTRSMSLRIFFPLSVDGGKNPIVSFAERLVDAHRRSTGVERERLAWLMKMIVVYAYLPNFDKRHSRSFYIQTLDAHSDDRKKTPFDETRETLRLAGLPSLDLMAAMARGVSADQRQLFQKAIYERPDLELTLNGRRYEEFRKQIIEELTDALSETEKEVDDFIDEQIRRLRKDRRRTAAGRSASIQSLLSNRADVIGRLMAVQLKQTSKRERMFASSFKDSVSRARSIHDQLSPLLKSEGLLDSDGLINCGSTRLRKFLLNHLQIASVDELIVDHLCRIVAHYELTPEELELPAQKVRTDFREDPDKSFAIESHHTFERMLRSKDVVVKWEAVCWILIRFPDRTNCARQFERECEHVAHHLHNSVHREIFRKIRRHLSPPERRLFLLMYCALPQFGGRIAVFDPPIYSFWSGMDDETQALIWLSTIHKMNSFGGESRLNVELGRRFSVYLKFYPFWVVLMRQHQNGKKTQRFYESETISLSSTVGDAVDSELGSRLADPLTANKNPLTAIALAAPTAFHEWVTKYCRPEDIPRLLKYYELSVSQSEIAIQEGVSQQAVSLTLTRGHRAVVEGLKRDGVI